MKRLVERSVGGGRYRLGVCRGRATMHPRVALCPCTRHETRGAGGEARRDARHRRAQEFYEGRVVGERGSRNKTSEERERGKGGGQETANKRGQERKKGDKGAKRLSVLDRNEGGGFGSYAHCFFTSRVLRCCGGKKKGKRKNEERILNAILEFQYTYICVCIYFFQAPPFRFEAPLIYFLWLTHWRFILV